jgi:DNA-binding CsgD family transcriptional regulator
MESGHKNMFWHKLLQETLNKKTENTIKSLHDGKKTRRHKLVSPNGSFSLSNREYQCVQCILAEMPLEEIPNKLVLSSRVINHYLNNIKRRVGCDNVDELIKFIKNGKILWH